MSYKGKAFLLHKEGIINCECLTQRKTWIHLKLERKAIHEGSNQVSARWWENIVTQEQDVTEELKLISLLLWVRSKMPEMETKFPDYTGKLTEFAVNKLIFIRSSLVNFFISMFCYFLCFSGVLASPSVPTDFVKLIFFSASYLCKTWYLQLVAFYYPFIISGSCLFSRFFQGMWKISNCKTSYFLLLGLYDQTEKLKPGKMNVNWDMTKQGMHYVSTDYQLISEWATEFSKSC